MALVGIAEVIMARPGGGFVVREGQLLTKPLILNTSFNFAIIAAHTGDLTCLHIAA